VYQQHPLAELVAVCDSDAELARRVAAQLGVRAYHDHGDLLEHESLDVVSIATPEQSRAGPTLAAAAAGLALMIEKPLAPTLAETDRLIAALAGHERPVAVNFILHADPRYSSMCERVRAGEIGRVATYFARRRGTRLGIAKYAPWTDLLISTAIHDLDMMLSLNPAPPERVFAEGVVRQCEPYGCEDAVMGLIRFTDGTVGSFETSWTLPPGQPELLEPSFHVVGDAGGIFIDGASHGMRVLTEESYRHPDMTHWPQLPLGIGGAFERSLGTFIERLVQGGPPLVTLAQARRAHELVEALKRSLTSGTPIPLPLSEGSENLGGKG
jgi:myo-inositol 2-dehydrogenase/D-chiro-inositol 1-dehydrogenase